MKFICNILTVFFVISISLFAIKSEAELATVDPHDAVYMVLGELEIYPVKNLTRLSIANPAVADVVSAESGELLLIAKSIGTTLLFIWDEQGKRTVNVNVFSQNLGSVQKRLGLLFDKAGIDQVVLEKNEREGKIVVTGFVPAHKTDGFNNIIEPFRDSVINFTEKEEVNNLVQIDLQITELNTTLSKKMGIDWSTGSAAGNGISLSYPETLPSDTGGDISDWEGVKDLFNIGEFNRTTKLLATIQALIQEGEAKILSQPKLVVMSGEEASFLVGGEVPIRTSNVSNGTVTENVTFKNFGVGMTVTPTIKESKVDIKMNIEVSEVDPSTASSVADTVAFSTRSASTRLFLSDGQTIIMAGLIKKSKSLSETRVPYLSKIPIAGLLFRSKSNPVADQDQELVIALTPHILSHNDGSDKKKAEQIESAEQTEKMIFDNFQTSTASTLPPDVVVGSDTVTETVQTGNQGNVIQNFNSDAHSNTGSIQNNSVDMLAENRNDAANNSLPIDYVMDATSADAPVEAGGIPQELNDYITALQQRITSAAQYPQEAREYGWEGTVKLNLLILSDGTLAFALIKESSGYEVFDEYALRAAKSVAPFEKFPVNASLQELNVTIPIVYNLNKS